MTLAKRFVVRAGAHNSGNIAQQQTRFNGHILGYASSLGTEVTALRRDVNRASERADIDAALADLRERLERLERAAPDERLSRLERGGLPPQAPVAADAPAPKPGSFDDVRLDAVLREAGDDLPALVAGRRGVVHLGCGDGALLDALGPGASGVESSPDLAAAALHAGRSVTNASRSRTSPRSLTRASKRCSSPDSWSD